jgi:hypothetical protein
MVGPTRRVPGGGGGVMVMQTTDFC